MKMFLHNIGELDGIAAVSSADALLSDGGVRYDYVLTNPPFGKKSSMTFTNDDEEQEKESLVYNRQDFWLKDKSLADLDNLPDTDLLAGEIIENLEAGLASFQEILGVLGRN